MMLSAELFDIFATGRLVTAQTVSDFCRMSMHITERADTAGKSTSLPFLCFAIEYNSTVSHCHSQ